MSRERLEDRRYCETFELTHDRVNFVVSYGRNMRGEIREVFVDGGKIGSGIEVFFNDFATVLSIALQYGIKPAELLKSMRRDASGRLSSPAGRILADMVKSNG